MARVCMVLNNYEPPFGGPELQARKIALRLIERGHSIIFVARGNGKAPAYEQEGGLAIYRLNHPGFASLEALWRLYRLRDQYDILHVHGVGRLASVALQIGKKYGKKVYLKVTTAGHIVKPAAPGLAGILKQLSPFPKRKLRQLQQVDKWIAISSEIIQELKNNGFGANKIVRIPNGVDTAVYHPVLSNEKAELRRQLNLPLDKKIFIFSGKITRRKGIDTLITAWAQTKEAKQQGLLLLVGSGQGQSDNLEDYLTEVIAKGEFADSVIRTGEVGNPVQYLAAADIFVFPSRREGLPNSLLEAMACGLLCIASDIGGNNDLITDGYNGYLVPANRIEQWSSMFDNAVRKPDSSLPQAAAATIRENYNLERTVDSLERLFGGKEAG